MRHPGLASGLALAVRPAGSVEAPGSTARRRRVPRSGMRSTVEAGGADPDNARRSAPVAVTFPASAQLARGLRPGPRGRALTWSYVDLDSDPPFMMVWHSVRAGGDTKTRKSRRTLKLPQRCVDVLRDHRVEQEEIRQAAGSRWQDNDLVFPSRAGPPADASHVRRSFRTVVAAAGLDPHEWTPRELRHSFVSLLSDADVPIEQISRLVGHSTSTTTETVYRKQIRPVIVHGALMSWTGSSQGR